MTSPRESLLGRRKRHSWRYYVYGTLFMFVVLLAPAFALGWGEPWWKPVALAGLSGMAWTPYSLAMGY